MRVLPVAVLAVTLSVGAACGDDDGTAALPPSTGSPAPPPLATTTVTVSTAPPELTTSTAPPPSQEPTVTSSSTPEPPPSPAPSSSVPSTSTSQVPDAGAGSLSPEAAAAVADLAARLSVDPASIVVIEQREVTWPDSSIGCPQPGMQYLQRLTPGILIVLEAGGQRHQYHAGGGRQPFLCASPRPPVAGG